MLYRRVRLRAAVLPEDSDGRLARASLSSLTLAALWEGDFPLRSEEVKIVESLPAPCPASGLLLTPLWLFSPVAPSFSPVWEETSGDTLDRALSVTHKS